MRIILNEDAKAMLTEFLRKTRHSRRKGGGARGVDSRKLDMVGLSLGTLCLTDEPGHRYDSGQITRRRRHDE